VSHFQNHLSIAASPQGSEVKITRNSNSPCCISCYGYAGTWEASSVHLWLLILQGGDSQSSEEAENLPIYVCQQVATEVTTPINDANIARIFLSRKVELLFQHKINSKYQESGICGRF